MTLLCDGFPAAAEATAPSYSSNGYVLWRPFLSSNGLAFLRHQVDRVLARTHASVSTEWIMNVHLLGESWLLDLAMEKHLLDAVQRFCGPDITLLQTHLFCKPQGITLDDLVAPFSGALVVLPGQHQLTLLPSEASDHIQFDRVLSSAFVDQHKSFRYGLHAGEAAVHHQWLPHASEGNTTLPYRRVIVLRYIATSVLETEAVALWRVCPGGSLVRVAQQDGDSNERELYPDFRTVNKYFEGRHVCMRGRFVDAVCESKAR
ncbi:hypothetical protein, variant 1 [Aphanomyces invadans]|uniref:Phytanoyl-CoA dioxygenase n=2 Tax=Aphanomyces invadans TaxID=157072 RepID=A0A024UM36_9STRA|nr:hypothetical protein, variant 1 [Aphanomyces invadans]ETW07506.1 hypothetical protein, variant 1 [Aphanomyces invadans]|eukprot:XP_008863599.1 hypothetical protein, variant 1 [Aphanomyces invadans]